MSTYLLTWNPNLWEWANLSEMAAAVTAGEVKFDRWSTGKRTHIPAGSRLFLLRQRVEPRGLMASGWSIGEVFQATHWDATRLELANYVRFRYDVLLDPAADGVLPVQSLRQGIPRDVNWSTQISGIEIAEEAASIVERLWAAHRRLPTTPATAELAALEGEFRRTLVTHYRREGQLRDAKLAEARRNGGRLEREVPGCGFSFGSVYGALGADYAHVHHLDPLGGGPERVTRLNRLVVVCANCHAMIHRGGRCRDYRTLINDQPAE